MLYNRCTGIYKFGNNTYPPRIRHRSNLGHIFRGGKNCVLWAGKYGIWCAPHLELILHPSTVHLHIKTHNARKQSSNVHSLVTVSVSLHLCFKLAIRGEKYRITSNLRCTFSAFSQTENYGASLTPGIIFHSLESRKHHFSWSTSDLLKGT